MRVLGINRRDVVTEKVGALSRWGFFLMPFENLAIAPSAGWPAVSPLLFFLAFALGRNRKLNGDIVAWVVILATLSAANWLSVAVSDGFGRFFARDVLSGLAPVVLGVSFFLLMRSVFFADGVFNRNRFAECMGSLYLGSIFALLFSVCVLVAAHILKAPAVLAVLELILKRNADVARFAFVFAEPSFVTVHIFGVLIPFAWLCWRVGLADISKKLIGVIVVYVLISVVYLDSVRFNVDLAMLVLVTATFWKLRGFVYLSRIKILAVISFVIVAAQLMVVSPEIISTLTSNRIDINGAGLREVFNSDGSLASRFFRIDAVIAGMIEKPYYIPFGVGWGNVGFIVDAGYSVAESNYTSLFYKEVDQIRQDGSGPNIYNMYVKLFAEYGIVVPIVMFYRLYSRKTAYLYVIIGWCYLQFDSYAFYGIWIYLIALYVVKDDAVSCLNASSSRDSTCVSSARR